MLAVISILIAAFLVAAVTASARTNERKLSWHRNRPVMFRQWLIELSSKWNIRPEWLGAIIYIESRGNPEAVNPGDPSFGIAQMMEPTATALAGRTVMGEELIQNPKLAMDLAAQFIAQLARRYNSRFTFAEWSQAYNVGETKFDRGIRNPRYTATGFRNPQEVADAVKEQEGLP